VYKKTRTRKKRTDKKKSNVNSKARKKDLKGNQNCKTLQEIHFIHPFFVLPR